jgi:hypothetical protein
MEDNVYLTLNEPERLTQQALDVVIKKHEQFIQGRLGGVRAQLAQKDLSGLSMVGKVGIRVGRVPTCVTPICAGPA